MTRSCKEAGLKVFRRPTAHLLDSPESRIIQLPYHNRFETIWEYKESFLSGRIDFLSVIGCRCPICGALECYRRITPYRRYAIELFARFKKSRVPIARFICRRRQSTFSLLPIQLIPYFQYTVNAVLGVVLLAFRYWQMGRRGFYSASVQVDPDSMVTPYLVGYWLTAIISGFRRAHGILAGFYDLGDVKTFSQRSGFWNEASGYFFALGIKPDISWPPLIRTLLIRYSRTTSRFLFGTASQQRMASCR